MNPEKARNKIDARRSFTVVYWALVCAGLAAVVLAFAIGTAQQRIVTGAVVMVGVILLSVGRLVVARRGAREADDSHPTARPEGDD